MKKKDILIVAALLIAALALYLLSGLLPKADLNDRIADVQLDSEAIVYLESTPQPTEDPQETAQVMGPMPRPQTQEIRGYVVLTVGGRQYGDPIAMDRDKIITLKQESGEINKVHITPDGVVMESSTCANQDCVGQEMITPDNYEERVLGSYIICLPNNVTIEFIPAE